MATKKFSHAVIYDGVFYPAGTEIKIKEQGQKAVVHDVDGGAGGQSKRGGKSK